MTETVSKLNFDSMDSPDGPKSASEEPNALENNQRSIFQSSISVIGRLFDATSRQSTRLVKSIVSASDTKFSNIASSTSAAFFTPQQVRKESKLFHDRSRSDVGFYSSTQEPAVETSSSSGNPSKDAFILDSDHELLNDYNLQLAMALSLSSIGTSSEPSAASAPISTPQPPAAPNKCGD